jgi:hypothetical protein
VAVSPICAQQAFQPSDLQRLADDAVLSGRIVKLAAIRSRI